MLDITNYKTTFQTDDNNDNSDGQNQDQNQEMYKAVCPECKNDIEVKPISEEDYFECPVCGITLIAKDVNEEEKTIENPEIAEVEK